MKKLFALLIAVVLVATFALSAGAATGITAKEKEIIDALSTEITMKSGTVVALPAVYVNQAKDFLTRAELTDPQVEAILVHIEAAIEAVEASDAKSLGQTAVDVKEAVIAEAEGAAEVVGATLSVTKSNIQPTDDGDVTADYTVKLIFGSDAVTGYEQGDSIEVTGNSGDVIKQTGAEADMTATAVAAVVVLAAVAFVVVASRKNALSK